MKIVAREAAPRTVWALEQAGVHPLLARLYAARGVRASEELDDGLARLLPPEQLRGAREAAVLLADAIAQDVPICVVADYDCDGATACAVALRGLRLLGARRTGYLVPDRVVDGYGLTPPIAERVAATGARLLVTVDNGIASVEGVAHAKALGLSVLVTDHHLPAIAPPPGRPGKASAPPGGGEPCGEGRAGAVVLPAADVVVNPNQPGCEFPSKSIAGVGVMFYVLLALRAELRRRGAFGGPARPGGSEPRAAGSAGAPAPQPRLDSLLPLVALGTVADVVRLDANNRRLVAQGLRRIRAGQMPAGLAALFQAAGRQPAAATTFDFGFALGPRINAAGRLADMTLGIECLLTDDSTRAGELARLLDGINRERRELEGGMREQALRLAESLFAADAAAPGGEPAPPAAISVFGPDFHEGVVGIVASRLKERFHRPAFVFAASAAPGREGEIKGSGRSIAGFHLRDALDVVAKRHPGVLLRFGGHAMAAGCTVAREHFATFEQALAQVAREWLAPADLQRRIDTDGALAPEYLRVDLVDTLHREVWGQGFAPPTFSDEVEVLSQRLVGEKHLALKLRHQGRPVDGIWFGRTEPLPPRVKLAYRLDADEWQGVRRVRLLVEGAEV
ncbi:MAG: DHHA1 domain-containing protein [Pseudomonas sp.]